MTELKSCPFCGGEAHTLLDIDKYAVGCNSDVCLGFIGLSWLYDTEAEAIAAWNTRAPVEMEGFFYLPKPKQRLFNYTTGFSFDDMSLKATGTVDVYALADAVRKWQEEELNQHIVERICEVFKPERTCKNDDTDSDDFFQCSECGNSSVTEFLHSGYGVPHYCPNCGARVTKSDQDLVQEVDE